MKKRITALALFFALVLILTGCGKSKAVKETEKLIGAIGTVTVDSAAAVEAAERAYNALSGDERDQVSNAAALTAARKALDEAVRDALRSSLAGTWETQRNLRDEMVAEMDSQFSGSPKSFGDYLDNCVLTLRLEMGENGLYRLAADTARLEALRQSVRDASAAFVSDYLLFRIGLALEESGVKGDFSTREGIEAAVGMDLDEIIRSSFDTDLEAYIDQIASEVDPLRLLPGVEGTGRFTVTEEALFFSADPEKEPGDGGAAFSLNGGMLTLNVPDGADFPLTGTCVFTRID